jgi:hypothetical protein
MVAATPNSEHSGNKRSLCILVYRYKEDDAPVPLLPTAMSPTSRLPGTASSMLVNSGIASVRRRTESMSCTREAATLPTDRKIDMISKSTRRVAPAVLLAALTASVTSSASAATVIPVPAKDSCVAFGLEITASDGKVRMRTLKDRNGKPARTISVATGVTLTYTNVVSKESVSIKTSGSVSNTVTNPDGTQTVTLTGHNGLIMFENDVPGPSAIQYTGRVVFTIGKDGVFTLISATGPALDICAELT